MSPTGVDGGEKGGWALVDPGLLKFFGLNMLTYTGCAPDLRDCDISVFSSLVLQPDVLHPLALGCASMASSHSFPTSCGWLQSSLSAGLPVLATLLNLL